MTKEEILNGMSEEEFYDMYPTPEDWENAQQMKLGGLSGAPHDGQPTADEFFSYGSHANDAVNVPMSNPFFASNGGTPYYGGPVRPYAYGGGLPNGANDMPCMNCGGYMDMGGNTASPMNYGAFSVPMQYGGYEQAYGGALDPGNNQQYPILEEGGKAALMDIIKAHSKKMKKAYKDGGDTVMQGGNSNDYPTNLTNNFKKVLKQNMYNHMVNEEEQAFANEFMQMGGYQGQGMNYNTTTFNEKNPQNQAMQNMYNQRISDYDTNFQNNMGNLSNAAYNLNATATPYTQTTIKAQDGVQVLVNKQTGKPFTADEYSQYEKYFGKKNQSQPAVSTSTNTQQSQNINPSFNLKEISHRHFGPWGKTKMTFGYRDQAPLLDKNQNIKDYNYTPGAESNQAVTSNSVTNVNQSNDPYADYKHNPYNPASQNPRNTESWFSKMKTVMGDKRNTPKEDFQGESWFSRYKGMKAGQREDRNRLKRLEEEDRQVGPYVSPEEEMAYGGLTRAQYGKDYKSTNPADGTYDASGNLINASSTTGSPSLTSNPISTGSSFQPTGNAPGAAPSFTNFSQTIPAVVPAATTNKQTSSNPTSFQSGWNYAGANTATPTPQSAGVAQNNITMTGVQAPKVVPEQNKIGSPMGPEKEATITYKQKPGYNGMAAASTLVAGIDLATSAINKAKDKSKQGLADLQVADNAYLANPANAQSQGGYDQWGNFELNQKVPVQFAGYSAYGGSFQEGGAPDQAQPDPQQVMEGVAQMLQQGAQPEQIAKQLVQMGIPQEQVMQIIQTVMQQLQGGQQEQPPMRYGGYAMGGYQEEDESYEDDLNEDEIAELRAQGYDVEYLD